MARRSWPRIVFTLASVAAAAGIAYMKPWSFRPAAAPARTPIPAAATNGGALYEITSASTLKRIKNGSGRFQYGLAYGSKTPNRIKREAISRRDARLLAV